MDNRIALLFVVLAGLGLVLVLSVVDINETPPEAETDDPPPSPDRRVTYTDEGRVLRVVDDAGTEVLRYSIEAFNRWTTAHWDEVFDERPSFGEIREVDVDGFRQFDRGAALSPQGDMLAFSVSDYAAATTLSFVVFLDVASEDVTLVDAINRGGVDELRWSPGGRYVAYRLHTARAHGDGLSVARAAPPATVVSLTGADVLTALDADGDLDPSSFQPAFDDLTWASEGRLSFTSRSPEGDEVRWQVGVNEADLTRTDGAGTEGERPATSRLRQEQPSGACVPVFARNDASSFGLSVPTGPVACLLRPTSLRLANSTPPTTASAP